jgi:hypothetical protein
MICSISGPIVAELGLPDDEVQVSRRGQPLGRALEIAKCRARDLQQLAIELKPFRTAAAILDRPGPLLGRAAVVVPGKRAVAQFVRLPQQPRHHPYGVPQQAAVGRCVDECGGDGAVHTHHAAAFQFLAPRARKQHLVDLFPGRRADRADRLVQNRLLRAPTPWQTCKRPERSGVLQVERQFLVAELAMLLEERAAQDSLRRQALTADPLYPVPAQVPRHQTAKSAMLIQPVRHGFQFTADLVFGEKIE